MRLSASARRDSSFSARRKDWLHVEPPMFRIVYHSRMREEPHAQPGDHQVSRLHDRFVLKWSRSLDENTACPGIAGTERWRQILANDCTVLNHRIAATHIRAPIQHPRSSSRCRTSCNGFSGMILSSLSDRRCGSLCQRSLKLKKKGPRRVRATFRIERQGPRKELGPPWGRFSQVSGNRSEAPGEQRPVAVRPSTAERVCTG